MRRENCIILFQRSFHLNLQDRGLLREGYLVGLWCDYFRASRPFLLFFFLEYRAKFPDRFAISTSARDSELTVRRSAVCTGVAFHIPTLSFLQGQTMLTTIRRDRDSISTGRYINRPTLLPEDQIYAYLCYSSFL